MWLFTQHGFYSVVADREHPGRFLVRARVRNDLENLGAVTGISAAVLETRAADYRYRVSLDAADLARMMAGLARTIDYPNFKGRIGQRQDQRSRLNTYHVIWAEAAKLQSLAST